MFLTGMLIVKVAMTHLWSLPMWIMSLASASFACLKYLLLSILRIKEIEEKEGDLEAVYVDAHSIENVTEDMTKRQRFWAEGDAAADSTAKLGANLDIAACAGGSCGHSWTEHLCFELTLQSGKVETYASVGAWNGEAQGTDSS